MPYTVSQQARLDAAKNRLDAAIKQWDGAQNLWNTLFVGEPCYTDTKYDAIAAATWFTPNDSSCSTKGDCKTADKNRCKNNIAQVRNRIPEIKSAYTEYLAAKTNYDTVVAQVNKEVQNDPGFILEQQQIKANMKTIIFIGVAVIIVAGLVFIYFKWIRK